jgi:hypothetical protein
MKLIMNSLRINRIGALKNSFFISFRKRRTRYNREKPAFKKRIRKFNPISTGYKNGIRAGIALLFTNSPTTTFLKLILLKHNSASKINKVVFTQELYMLEAAVW